MSNYIELGFCDQKYYDFPNIVNLEVFRGACPCECVHCPVGLVAPNDRGSRFGQATIDLATFRKVIDEMSVWPHSTIRIHSVGEPILWTNLIPALEYLKKSTVRSWIFSSLVTKNKAILEALCNCCDIVEVSVNSIDTEDYRETKGIDVFDLVSENIRYMSAFIKSHQLKTRLVVSRVQSDSKEKDDAFISYWRDTGLCADAFVRKYHNYNNLLDEKGGGSEKKVACLVHWMRFSIAYDGTVVCCFNELFHPNLRDDVVMGNILSESIYDIWHGEKFLKLRAAELSGYTTGDYPDDFPCRNCFSCQAYDKKHETSEHQIDALK